MVQEQIHSLLETQSGKKLNLRFNNNRSTMLSVRWEPDHVRVSLHRMFLEAPQNVMDELACYLGGTKRAVPKGVKQFMETQMQEMDYSKKIDRQKLASKGVIYDLEEIYNQINRDYFEGAVDLSITWYGKPVRRTRTSVNFGLYESTLKLVKIHRLLDNPIIPDYFVEFVVYHEMLHHVCPPYYDQNGVHRIHSPEFKEREKQFRYHRLAKEWLEANKRIFFQWEV